MGDVEKRHTERERETLRTSKMTRWWAARVRGKRGGERRGLLGLQERWCPRLTAGGKRRPPASSVTPTPQEWSPSRTALSDSV